MEDFLQVKDDLAATINTQAKALFEAMRTVPVDELDLPADPKRYYKQLHNNRLFFSVQSASELLYRSIKQAAKPPSALTIMDYGGGMGTIFLLGKMIGCRRFIYADIREDMQEAAEKVSQYLKVPVDYFLVGDHRQICAELNRLQLSCDIVLSRNVVEHIYDLSDFYTCFRTTQPDALLYFSTTANYHNPAMLWYHKGIHKRFETGYIERRREIIREQQPDLSEAENHKLAVATRGLAMDDLRAAIDRHKASGVYPDPDRHYSNTCDPDNGLWQEHIIPYKDYFSITAAAGYRTTIHPAFWDTHYHSRLKNLLAGGLNKLMAYSGKWFALRASPFIYIESQAK